MAEVKEEFLERYADFIRGLAKEKSPQLFTNGGIAYASQLMAVLFENTDKEARIFCQGFKPDLITTDPYWGALHDYLAKKDKSLRVLVETNEYAECEPIQLLKKEMSERKNDTIQITPDVFVAKDSRVKLGDGYVMRDLIDEMMLVSDNDAAYALAKHIGGDTLKFCEMMNDKAISIGLGHTHFANPNGMPNLNNYSTACDLVKLSRYCMRDSLFAQIVGTQEKDIPLTDGRHMPCRNTNALLTTYEGCLGIKTGFTRQAGNCLASVATRDGVTLYLVLLNSRSMSTRFTESAILLDYGFEVMKAYRRSTLGGSSLK